MDDDKDLPELHKVEIEKIVDEYKNVYQSTISLSSAFIEKSRNDSSTFIVTEWSQRNLERDKTTKIQRTILCNKSLNEGVNVNTVDISNWTSSAFSKSENLKAVVQSISEVKDTTKNYLQIWNDERSLMTFDLAALDQHGLIYSDELFGSLSWSPSENEVLYIAEKSQPKTAPFYQQKQKPDQDEKNKLAVGEQHVYDDDWGEQMSPKRLTVIAVCDIKQKNIRILDGLPENVCPGQVVWDPTGNGVVGVAYHHKPRRLGIMFCTNRKCDIFHLSLEGKYTVLSEESKSVSCPKFSPDGKYLVWLERTNTGPHYTISELIKYDWITKEKCVLVPSVDDVVLTKNGKEFHGIFVSSFPRRCWTSDSKYILFSSVQKYRINSYAVNIDDGSIWDIGNECEYESISILDISEDDYVVASKTSFIEPTALVSLKLPTVFTGQKCTWNCITESVKYDSNIIKPFTVNDLQTKEQRCFAIYYGPQGNTDKSVPLILYPHGGPHSSVPSNFTPYFHLLSRLGFGVLIVIYQGSLGCGKKFVDILPGNVGTLDVEDCYSALHNAFEKFPWLDKEKVLLYGGSHGGFLVTHLSSQYPDEFISTVAINPVTNIPAMLYVTDIPDWALVESGYPYDGMADVINNTEVWKKMAEVSPVKRIKSVKTPTLLLMGKKDLRVPPSQGLSYYNMLNELNVPTKAFFYDDNHSLKSLVSVEMDSVINSIIWFNRCLKKVIKKSKFL